MLSGRIIPASNNNGWVASERYAKLLVLLVVLFTAACASAPDPRAPAAPPPAQARPSQPVNPADVEFMSGMIHHHAQAVLMAAWAPTHGASNPIRTLAERISVAQRDEIALMQNWLRDRGLPVEEATPVGMKMKMDGMEHVMLMPGMLTAEQLKQLDQARAAQFDRLFLTFMIQHHQGALTMVDKLLKSYGAAQDETVFRFSADVSADQTTEIERMQQMLAQMESSR